MSTTNISIRMDEDLKKEADLLFSEMGMNISTAFNIFVRQAIRERAIPFQIHLGQPNLETIAAMLEAEKIAKDPNVPSYATAREAFAAALSEEDE
ncbi:MAG: type II toxin-antitoxin system RelB/DinJ family antitoxin [Eubacteriales bacterium]|nr:type II toxin-antitoxin system RelB/DinJ family antitoxin [Eubacteriales bacterium]